MKIFRAIQISLKELHRPNDLTRIISSQYPVTSEISPCEYKVKAKAKSKDKSKTSKMNKLFRNLRRFSATGHRKASTINTNPLSGCIFDASKNSLQIPDLVPARQNSSYQCECGAHRRSCELYDKVHGVAVNELSVPITIDSLLETARSFTANEGSTLKSCDEHQDIKSIEDGIESIQPDLLRMISPKIASKMVIEEMLRIVSSKTRDLMLLETTKHEGRRWSSTPTWFLEGEVPAYDYTAQEFAKTLQSMIYASDTPNCYLDESDTGGKSKYNNFSRKNLLAERSIFTYKPQNSHFSDLPCYMQASNYHTLKTAGNHYTEYFPMLPAGLSGNSRSVTRSKFQAKSMHLSHQMGNANKNIDDEWYMHSKRIASSDMDASRGSGLVLVSGEAANVQALDHNEVISSNEAKFPGRDAPKFSIMANVSSTGHPQAAYDTLGNSTLSSKSDGNQADKTNVESSTLGQESVNSKASDKNAMSFRSTLSPEFVRPRMTNFEFSFDEEDTPHIAMLYSFCAPLPAEAYRENIIPIRVVDAREQAIDAARVASNDDKQGLLKSILDKLNLLKW